MTPQWSGGEFARLLRRARVGDDDAWSQIYRWLAPEVLGFLTGTGLDDSEDILGDVFLEVARRIADFEGDQRGFRAWVFTIARSRRIDVLRKRARNPHWRLDTAEHEVLPASDDVEADVVGNLSLQDLLDYLKMLTDDQAEVLVLRAIGELTAPEIAEITGRTVGAVEQLQHRATKALRHVLETRKESAPVFGDRV
jgi:RNA polymerase sigma-70 factor (ECF subfamily)